VVGDRVVSGGVSGASEIHKENIINKDINAQIFMKDIEIEKIKRLRYKIKNYNYERMLELLNHI